MKILAIDPGNTESGWVIIDATTRRPLRFGKTPNDELLTFSRMASRSPALRDVDHVAIEMIRSYGMSVGSEVFETCVWIGRFHEALHSIKTDLVYRTDVKVHICHSNKAKDSNISQALVDRFAPGTRNHGKGTKADPGWFYGFRADIWQAYALAVLVADTRVPQEATF